MFRRFHRPLAWLTLFAWLSASGLSWDALQVFAWAKMSVDNAREASLGAAVGKAMKITAAAKGKSGRPAKLPSA